MSSICSNKSPDNLHSHPFLLICLLPGENYHDKHILWQVKLKESTFMWICICWGYVISKKNFCSCYFFQLDTNSHSAFLQSAWHNCTFLQLFPLCQILWLCTSLFFLGNQTKKALQPILLFQAKYPDTVKATIKITGSSFLQWVQFDPRGDAKTA